MSSVNKPRISVIIPSFEQGKYIEKTIQSVLNQKVEGLQLIVMDGGSKDNTLKVLNKYAAQIDVCVSESDHGQTDAINKGLRHAKADIVSWINSDDLYLPGALQKVLRIFERNPEIGVVHGNRLLIDAESCVVGWVCGRDFRPNEYGYNINSETAFWRVGLLDEEFDASLKFTMDVDWFSRLYVAKAKFHFISEFLGAFRCHDENKSSTIQHICREEGERCWVKYFGNEKWKISPPTDEWRFYSSLLRHPLMLTAPYIYQRFVLPLKSNNPP